MARYGIRFLVAVLTFIIGITIAWTLRNPVASFSGAQIENQRTSSPLVWDRVKDANEVYRVILHERLASDTKLVVLLGETTSYKIYEFELQKTPSGETESVQQWLNRMMPAAELQTIDDYVEQNRAPGPLQVSDLGLNYVLATSSDLGDLDGFWVRFHKKYANSSGLVFFSKVGFNAAHDQAFVYVGNSCGGLCGATGFVFLRKIGGQWVIQQTQGASVS